MGFWDRQIADLAVAGVTFSDSEVDLLENGGKAMFLAELPDPSVYYGGDYTLIDEDEEIVLVPVMLDVRSPLEDYIPAASEHGPVCHADYLDAQWGEEWRRHPAYTAYVDDGDRWSSSLVSFDDVRPIRPWACAPLLTPNDEEVFRRLQKYTHERLNAGHFFDVDAVCWVEAQGEIAMEDACVLLGLVEPPADYNRIGDMTAEDIDWDPDYLKSVAGAYKDLCDAGICFRWSWSKETTGEPFVIPRIEDYFDPDDLEAYDLWSRVVARRKSAEAKAARFFYPNMRPAFHQAERAFA